MKSKSKSKKKTKKCNVYTREFKYYNNNLDLLTQISSTLKPNQWIILMDKPFKLSSIKKTKLNKNNKEYDPQKPYGSWFSKGDGLFHDFNILKPNQYITIVEVDYEQLYCIKNKDPEYNGLNSHYKSKMTSFLKKYRRKTKHKSTKHKDFPQYDDFTFESYVIKWHELYNKYNGFCLFPYQEPIYNEINRKQKKFVSKFPNGWDVTSLVLWNKKSIVKHYNLGTIKDIIKSKSKSKKEITKKQKQLFINNLIKQIKTINNK